MTAAARAQAGSAVTQTVAATTRLEPAVRTLLARAGVQPTAGTDIAAVPGGRNNRIYKIRAGSECFALKCYHRDPDDLRDRFAAETVFLEVVSATGVTDSPQLLATDADGGLALLEWIDGTPVAQVTRAQVDAALAFIERINAPGIRRIALRRLNAASQSAGTISEHSKGLIRRVSTLRDRWSCPPHWRETAAPTIDRLERRLQAVLDSVDRAPRQPLTHAQRVVSPSDFGFHNAIDRGDSVAFIDFEYAGWDDPAKLVCDFFLQPRVPVPRTLVHEFTLGIAGACGLDHEWLAHRVVSLLPICRLLWCCIALNVFDPVHLRRRVAATSPGDMDDLFSAQLALANAFMDEPDRI
jgi:hypothetical protein